MMRKYIVGGLIGATLVFSTQIFAEEGLQKIEAYIRSGLPITLDGKKVTLESAPVMVDGSTYLKLRDIAKITGLDVYWNEVTQTVELSTYDIPSQPTPPTPSPIDQNVSSSTNETQISKKDFNYFGDAYDSDTIFFNVTEDGFDTFFKKYNYGVIAYLYSDDTNVIYDTFYYRENDTSDWKTSIITRSLSKTSPTAMLQFDNKIKSLEIKTDLIPNQIMRWNQD